jgi:hypothetical protein
MTDLSNAKTPVYLDNLFCVIGSNEACFVALKEAQTPKLKYELMVSVVIQLYGTFYSGLFKTPELRDYNNRLIEQFTEASNYLTRHPSEDKAFQARVEMVIMQIQKCITDPEPASMRESLVKMMKNAFGKSPIIKAP